jgi:WS/DGAT/MGAT family acyltransferase
MQQLSGMDAAFLALETPAVTGHVGGLAILDPSNAPRPLTLDRLTALLAQRLHLVPLLRRRLVEVPFGVDQPYWVDDPDFDLEFHVRELAIPAPGNDQQLCEQISRLHSRPLDRARPLWEMYLISGLAGGRMAVYTKIHHAAIDGVAGAELMTTLLDLTREGRVIADVPDYDPEPLPRRAGLLLRAAVTAGSHPRRAVRVTTNLLRFAPTLTQMATPFVRGLISRGEHDGGVIATAGPAPATRLNRPITAHRRFAFRTVSLADVKEIKNAVGVTVNDVFVAVSAAAIRRWLLDHDDLPDAPLVAMLPVALKVPRQGETPGNRVSAMFSAIPTHLADPIERLKVANEATVVAKAQQAAIPEGLVEDVTEFFAPALAARAARLASSMSLTSRIRPVNVVLSNVPGANIQVYLAGAEVLTYYPVSVVVVGVGLNITVQSYNGGLHFGLIACRELVPDLERMADYIVEETEQLLSLVRRQPPADPFPAEAEVIRLPDAAEQTTPSGSSPGGRP